MTDDIDAAVYVSMTLETKIIRIIDTLLIPSKLTIRTDIHPEDFGSIATTAAILRIRTWVDNYVNGSIVFTPENLEAYGMFFDAEGAPRASNRVMLSPVEPTDDVLATVFQAKFKALAGEVADFDMCEVSSDNALGLRFTFIGDPSLVLPPMDQWVGPRSYFDHPWWNRNDASTHDVIPGEESDLSQRPKWAHPIRTGLDDLDDSQGERHSSMILRPNFKPVVIDGGKKPDA